MKPPRNDALAVLGSLFGLSAPLDIASILKRDGPAPRRRKIAKQERLARRAKRKAAKASRRANR